MGRRRRRTTTTSGATPPRSERWVGAIGDSRAGGVVEKNGAGDGGHDATELARAYANRGWARLLRGTVDAADADLAAARRALEDFSLLAEDVVDEDFDDDDDDDDDIDRVGSSPSSSSSSSSSSFFFVVRRRG